MTSHDVVARIRRILKIKAVGHAGTLDPLATGLMILLIGEATKISDYLLNNTKSYRVKIKLGLETDSLDITGKILSQKSTENISDSNVQDVVKSLTGELELPVPKFSAVKVDGKKLLDRALKNEEFNVPLRKMEFYNIQLLSNDTNIFEYELSCTKGSFIRSWVHELGQRLGCGAVVEELRRTKSDPYFIDSSSTLSELEALDSLEKGKSYIPLENCLLNWEALTVSGRDEKLISNGQVPNALVKRLIFQQKIANKFQKSFGIRIYKASSGELASLLELEPYKNPKIKRIFKY